MLRYGASTLTVPEIGRELAARYVVEGSVRRFENHVRVTIQLIDAGNDHHLWASNFERELANVFETQSDLAREISNAIQLQIAPETVRSLQGKPTTSALAYDLYQKAESIEKSEGETEASTVRRRKLLEQAVKEDPEFVEAWGKLKRMYDQMLWRIRQFEWTYGSQDVEALQTDLRSRSARALTKAITLDPDNVGVAAGQRGQSRGAAAAGSAGGAQEGVRANLVRASRSRHDADRLRLVAYPHRAKR